VYRTYTVLHWLDMVPTYRHVMKCSMEVNVALCTVLVCFCLQH